MTALKSQTHLHKLFDYLTVTLLGVLMYVSQVIMAPLPNIEVVSLLIIITTCAFGVKSLCSVYIFVFCEVMTYGFSMWVINYLYVWVILWIIIFLLRKAENHILFALISGIYGLFFGTLCSIPYFITGGIGVGITYIIKGFWFDIAHCGGNFLLALLLFKPLYSVLMKTVRKYNKT